MGSIDTKDTDYDYEHCDKLNNNDSLVLMNNEPYDNELCDNGGGVLINNSMHTTNQMYNDYVVFPPEVIYLVAISQPNVGLVNLCSVNRIFMKGFGSEGLSSHILSLHTVDEHRETGLTSSIMDILIGYN